jgi:hypothetical protein
VESEMGLEGVGVAQFLAMHQECNAGFEVSRSPGPGRPLLMITCTGCRQSVRYPGVGTGGVADHNSPAENGARARSDPAPPPPAPAPRSGEANPQNPVACYALERGSGHRRLAGFLIVHASCGSGFDFAPTLGLSEGHFDAACLGCGKRFSYDSAATPAPGSPQR